MADDGWLTCNIADDGWLTCNMADDGWLTCNMADDSWLTCNMADDDWLTCNMADDGWYIVWGGHLIMLATLSTLGWLIDNDSCVKFSNEMKKTTWTMTTIEALGVL